MGNDISEDTFAPELVKLTNELSCLKRAAADECFERGKSPQYINLIVQIEYVLDLINNFIRDYG